MNKPNTHRQITQDIHNTQLKTILAKMPVKSSTENGNDRFDAFYMSNHRTIVITTEIWDTYTVREQSKGFIYLPRRRVKDVNYYQEVWRRLTEKLESLTDKDFKIYKDLVYEYTGFII